MKGFLLQIVLFCLAGSSFCQLSRVSVTVPPYSTYLLDSVQAKEIVRSLEGFLTAHASGSEVNHYIEPSYSAAMPRAFGWLNVDTSLYRPTLLSILPVMGHEQFLIALSYVGLNSEKKPSLALNYSLIAKRNSGKYFFYSSLDYHTRNWNRTRVGKILYIYPNKFNRAVAKKLDVFNKAFAKKMSVDALPITYYKCEDPVQVFKILGCDYIPNMYLSNYGGLAETNNTVFAGNNSEWYPHEIVHFYTNKFPSYNRIAHEGYATFIGGSGGMSVEELKALAKQYLVNHPDADLDRMFTRFERIERGIPFTYIASALIFKEVETRYGWPVARELFKADRSDESYFAQLEKVTGVKKAEFAQYLKGLINN